MNLKLLLLICALIYLTQMLIEIGETIARHDNLDKRRRRQEQQQQKLKEESLKNITFSNSSFSLSSSSSSSSFSSLISFSLPKVNLKNTESLKPIVKPKPLIIKATNNKKKPKPRQFSDCRADQSAFVSLLIAFISSLIKVAALHLAVDFVNFVDLRDRQLGHRLVARIAAGLEQGLAFGPLRRQLVRAAGKVLIIFRTRLFALLPAKLHLAIEAVRRAQADIAEFSSGVELRFRFLPLLPVYTVALLALNDLSLRCSLFGLLAEELLYGTTVRAPYYQHFFLLYAAVLTY